NFMFMMSDRVESTEHVISQNFKILHKNMSLTGRGFELHSTGRTNSEREPAKGKRNQADNSDRSSKRQTTPFSPPLLLPSSTRMASECNATLPISFFKVIMITNLQTVKIPNTFTAKYGGGLPNPLFMKLPDETQWKIIWENANGEIWLREGWKEFVEHYSLEHGHFVFFDYEGIDQIDVKIFKQSGVEIDYSCATGNGNDNLDQNLHQNEDEPIVILDEEESPEQIGGGSVQRTSSLNQPNQTKAREVACNFISCNPFFTVAIKPSLAMEYRLYVPDLEGIIEKKKYVVLQRGERLWKVKLLYNKGCFSRYSFGAGVHLFLTENELKVGDVCIFELISKKNCIFKVHVF
ncbi:hypothetical protein V8G54_028770, partial [Vigna mungo]